MEENNDFIICKLCGEKVKRIYGKHLKYSHNDMTSVEYRKMFPGAPLQTESDKKSVCKNSGLHMKQDRYKKMFSERVKGNKNPMHKSNMSEQKRKESSPFSKEFYKKRGLNEKDRVEFTKKALQEREFDTRIEYWEKRGYTQEESIGIISKRQTTFSLKKCIEKYGEEDGIKRWNERQKKWLSNMKIGCYSKVSQELFHKIYKTVKRDFKKIYFATVKDNGKNNEFVLNIGKRSIKPDFFIMENKKIIEFDGVYWHRNNPENKLRELKRDKEIINSGFKILHINENDYYKNPSKIIKECIDFIYDENT